LKDISKLNQHVTNDASRLSKVFFNRKLTSDNNTIMDFHFRKQACSTQLNIQDHLKLKFIIQLIVFPDVHFYKCGNGRKFTFGRVLDRKSTSGWAHFHMLTSEKVGICILSIFFQKSTSVYGTNRKSTFNTFVN